MNARSRRTAIALFATGALLLAGAADAAGFLVPSFAAGRGFDDNLFFTATDKTSDAFWRASPAVDLGLLSESNEFRLRGSFDAEYYAVHTELDDPMVRREASLDWRLRATPRLDLELAGGHLATQVPAELAPAAGFESGRRRAERNYVSPGFEYRFSPITALDAGYEAGRESLEDGIATDTERGMLGIERALGARNRVRLDHTEDRYEFDGLGETNSRATTFGWAYEHSRFTTLDLRTGRRSTEGSTQAEISLLLERETFDSELALFYGRSQTPLVGRVGVADTRTFTAVLAGRVGRNFEWRAGTTATRSALGGRQADVVGIDLEVRLRFNLTAALVARYGHDFQDGSIDGPVALEIRRNTAWVGVELVFASAADRASGAVPPSLLDKTKEEFER